jgi:cyclophilin family peptidyl-prolyl cis-trans isomerase
MTDPNTQNETTQDKATQAETPQGNTNQVAIGIAVLVWVLIIGGIGWVVLTPDGANDGDAITELPTPITQDDSDETTGDPDLQIDYEPLVMDDLSGTPEDICEAATPNGTPQTRQFDQAVQVLEEDADYQAIFCTSVGAVHIELFEEETPTTVNNLVFLAQEGFYNNTIFHRVIEDFMAQAGDPTGTGRGGPGYRFEDEFREDLRFDEPYLLAMANAGPGTNGSQFFITFEPTPWLNGAHTIFGEVISGQEVVDSIEIRDPAIPNAPATMLETVVIITNPAQVQ